MAKLTVGELRKLIADLPDDACIWPDWGREPGGDDPCVELCGFERVEAASVASPAYLAVMVALLPLDDIEDDDPCVCRHCGQVLKFDSHEGYVAADGGIHCTTHGQHSTHDPINV